MDMPEQHVIKMRWVMLFFFLALFFIIFVFTSISLFSDLIPISEEYQKWLVTAFILEVGTIVFSIGRSLFGLNKDKNHNTEMDQNNNMTDFPAISNKIMELVEKFGGQDSKDKLIFIDSFGASFVETISRTLQDDENFIAKALLKNITTELKQAENIMATDVLGPESWITPTAYLYLANQIRFYVKGNVINGEWSLVVSKKLGDAINNACGMAVDRLPEKESNSLFDNPSDFTWKIGKPILEFSRILRWTREELMSPIAESVINIHSAFHVPLFFIETTQEDKKLDYILFKQQDGLCSGYYSLMNNHFRPDNVNANGLIPGYFNALEDYDNLLSKKDLMFACDALAYFRNISKHSVNEQRKIEQMPV